MMTAVKKRLKLMILLFQAIGFVIFAFSSIYKDQMTDYAFGFARGISIVFILTGTIYIIYCAVKRKNPYQL